MPIKTEYVPAELYMEHNGVCIFHVYKDNDFDQGARDFWFATHEDGSDDNGHGEDGVFDVRELPVPPSGPTWAGQPPFIGHEHGREAGFDNYDQWKASDEYARRKALWQQWHESGEKAAIQNTIRHAIEAGILTVHGVHQPEVETREIANA